KRAYCLKIQPATGSFARNLIYSTKPSQPLNRASRSAPERVKRAQAIPRQDNIFKRFTTLVIDFLKQKFVWAKSKKSQIDLISEEHDKRIAENYVFDEVLGHRVPRAEYEKKAKFNQDDYKPTPDEINRFSSRPKTGLPERDHSMDLTPPTLPEQAKRSRYPQLKPLRNRDR
ncbi:molybdopterin-guanine dinucleotide biosynthesis protein MobA, partial [Klebsiella pneumoniae]|nr:molybdopterin-guanine dinucleotide biosynthesis protein MobA [Klebsiella pneumoniae]